MLYILFSLSRQRYLYTYIHHTPCDVNNKWKQIAWKIFEMTEIKVKFQEYLNKQRD